MKWEERGMLYLLEPESTLPSREEMPLSLRQAGRGSERENGKRKEAGERQCCVGQSWEGWRGRPEMYKRRWLPQAERMWFAKDVYNNTKPQEPLLQQTLRRDVPSWLGSAL